MTAAAAAKLLAADAVALGLPAQHRHAHEFAICVALEAHAEALIAIASAVVTDLDRTTQGALDPDLRMICEDYAYGARLVLDALRGIDPDATNGGGL